MFPLLVVLFHVSLPFLTFLYPELSMMALYIFRVPPRFSILLTCVYQKTGPFVASVDCHLLSGSPFRAIPIYRAGTEFKLSLLGLPLVLYDTFRSFDVFSPETCIIGGVLNTIDGIWNVDSAVPLSAYIWIMR